MHQTEVMNEWRKQESIRTGHTKYEYVCEKCNKIELQNITQVKQIQIQ